MSVQVTKLSNNLTIVSEHIDYVKSVSFGAYVKAGTRNELPQENGAAHFLEHMAFKGTKNRSALEIAETVEDVGGYMNAYTAREQTAYYVRLLEEDTSFGVNLIGDLLTHSIFDPKELERERNVIIQEIGQARDNPDDVVFDNFQGCAYPDQPMGRTILGPSSLIKSLSRESLMAYMSKQYASKNIFIAASGAINHDDLVKRCEDAFADISNHEPPVKEAAKYVGGQVHEKREMDQVQILLGFESPSYLDETYYASKVLALILGGGMASRLFQEIRERLGLVYSVYAFLHTFEDSGLFGISAGTSPEKIDQLLPAILEQLAQVCENIKDEEIKRAKAQLKSALVMSLESTSSRGAQIAQQMMIRGRPVPIEETLAKIKNIQKQDILNVGKKIFSTKPVMSTIGNRAPKMDIGSVEKRIAALI